MSGPLINRSLTTIRTELEFLHDSEVITDELFQALTNSLPQKYAKDMEPWGTEKLTVPSSTKAKDSFAPPAQPPFASVDSLANSLQSTSIAPPPRAPPKLGPKPLGYCKAVYDYQAQESDDLSFKKDDKLAITEHLSEDWWKGYVKSVPQKIGVFPSNYVTSISEADFEAINRPSPPAPVSEKQEYRPAAQSYPSSEKQEYNPPTYSPAKEEGYSYPTPPQQPQNLQPYSTYQPNYGQPGYGVQSPQPYTPTQYYQESPQQAPQQQTVIEQAGQQHPHLKKFGSKLGNAAIFGAGATIGSDLVNSIF